MRGPGRAEEQCDGPTGRGARARYGVVDDKRSTIVDNRVAWLNSPAALGFPLRIVTLERLMTVNLAHLPLVAGTFS